MKLNAKALALTLGIIGGICQLVMGWLAVTGWGKDYVRVLSSMYIGFKPGFWGGIIGGLWGFFAAAVGGAVIACLYNYLSKVR